MRSSAKQEELVKAFKALLKEDKDLCNELEYKIIEKEELYNDIEDLLHRKEE